MKRQILLGLLTYGSLILIGNATHCKAQSSVGVMPMSVDAKVKRGATYSQTYTLSNDTGARLRFTCAVVDYWYDEKNERITGRPGTLPRSASPWVQFSPSEVIVEPRTITTVRALISVPSDSAGGYYTMAVFTAMPLQLLANQTPSAMTATASIGIRFRGLIMLTTQDATEYNVEILKGKLKPPTGSSPLELVLDVRNRSTAHAFVYGDFALINSEGKAAGRGKIQQKKYLPEQKMELTVPWAGELPPGHYTAVVALSYNRVGMQPASLAYELPFEVKPSPVIAQSSGSPKN